MIYSTSKVTIGQKKNLAISNVPSRFVLTIDDDDFSLPHRIRYHLQYLKNVVYHKTFFSLIAENELTNIVTEKKSLCYASSCFLREIALKFKFKETDWCEDHDLYNVHASKVLLILLELTKFLYRKRLKESEFKNKMADTAGKSIPIHVTLGYSNDRIKSKKKVTIMWRGFMDKE